ncbi:hypothetical protein [Porphyromonas sp. COT-290 OH3588]|uniref:hypothetical protein n=1 Tax=Porphyromonas sp. COT-290 OH3588 TaxID=1515617 RepID=UPI00052E21C6|nr:hypothetical protein [Porphyromonas sp. COT-290 OH3588]KGN97424.1 hypothetical protein HQ48_08720 [Porphyromonas sp. COT-290 OH3588]
MMRILAMLAACAQILAIAVVEPSISVEVLSISSVEFYSSRGSLDELAPVEACQICPRYLLFEGALWHTASLRFSQR